MNSFLIIAIAGAGLMFIVILYKIFKKGSTLAKKVPTNFLAFFLIYALLGLTGFMMKSQVAAHPIAMGLLYVMVGITAGIVMTNNLYGKWEWSMESGIGKKILYLLGIILFSIIIFNLIFILSEHRGWAKRSLKIDVTWWFSALALFILVPLLVKYLHELWLEIPRKVSIIPMFTIPTGGGAPFIETGGRTVTFDFIIPLDYRSKDIVSSKIKVPFNKRIAEAFHYKLHEHNVVKQWAKKIIIAEGNKKAKMYGWYFYRTKSIWWGLFTKKVYLDPKKQVGATIGNGEKIFIERVKIWEH